MSGRSLYVLLAAAAPLAAQAELSVVESVVRIADEDARLGLRDFDGDGRLDLLRVDAAGATVARLGADGRYDLASFAADAPGFAWPEGRVGWDLSDLDGDGASELLVLREQGGVRVHRLDAEGAFDEGLVVLEEEAWLPRGVCRIRSARDVDGDGREDLILPEPGAHRIYLRGEEGYEPPLRVGYELDSELLTGDPERLTARIGQEVLVPWFRIEDVDGDGSRDLVAQTSERIAFHLSRPRLASEPTWVLSLDDLRAELPRRDGIDFDDLFSALDQNIAWRLADLDGVAPDDLVVQLGAKFRVYLGGAATGPVGTPDQVLKSSGNVLYSFIRQVEGSALVDLQLVRAERVSVGRVVRSLILPSALSFDLYTYANEGGSFSRSPTRRNRLTLEIPRLLSFIEDAEGFGESLEAQIDIPATRYPAAPGAPAEGDGVLDIEGSDVVLTLGCAPAPLLAEEVTTEGIDLEGLFETYFLEDFDARGDGAERTLDLADVFTLDLVDGAVLRSARRGVEPALRRPLAFPAEHVDELRVTDLDGDGDADVIAVGDTGEGWVVQLLIVGG